VQRYFDTHALVGISANNYVDFKNYQQPVQTSLNYVFTDQLDIFNPIIKDVTLSVNDASFMDNIFGFVEVYDQSLFITTSNVEISTLRALNPTAYFQANFRLADSVNLYNRVVYRVLDLIGDVGGVS